MIAILGLLVAIVSLLLCFLFDSSILLGIVVAVLGLLAFATGFLKEKKWAGIAGAVFLAASLVCMYFSTYKPDTHPVWESIHEIDKAAKKGSAEKASAALEELRNDLSNYDALCLALCETKIDEGKFDEAYDALAGISFKNTYYYFLKQKLITLADQSKRDYDFYKAGDDYFRAVKNIAYDAMVDCPDWSQAYTLYGAAALLNEQKNDVARYCLSGALSVNGKDGTSWYYLGIAEYESHNFESALECFKTASRYKLTRPIKASLNEYLALAKKEVEK